MPIALSCALPLVTSPAPDASRQRPAEEHEAERDSLDDVAPEQAARLVTEPVKPLQTQSLQHDRRARLIPGQETEGDPYPDKPGLGQLGPQVADEPLLFWEGEPGQDQLRLCPQEHRRDPLQLVGVTLEAKGRAVRLNSLEAGEAGAQLPGGGVGHP